MVTPPLLLVFATLVFIVGTEIRVRIEDSLLAAQFGESFQKYQRDVPAYIPFWDSQSRETFDQFISSRNRDASADP